MTLQIRRVFPNNFVTDRHPNRSTLEPFCPLPLPLSERKSRQQTNKQNKHSQRHLDSSFAKPNRRHHVLVMTWWHENGNERSTGWPNRAARAMWYTTTTALDTGITFFRKLSSAVSAPHLHSEAKHLGLELKVVNFLAGENRCSAVGALFLLRSVFISTFSMVILYGLSSGRTMNANWCLLR